MENLYKLRGAPAGSMETARKRMKLFVRKWGAGSRPRSPKPIGAILAKRDRVRPALMTTMTKRHIFGPVLSRRLGLSLGIDLVPFKTCSYDCAYCECGHTTVKTITRQTVTFFPQKKLPRRPARALGQATPLFDHAGRFGEADTRPVAWAGNRLGEATNTRNIP